MRWLGRFCLEARRAALEEVREAADAFAALGVGPQKSSGPDESAALTALTGLCARHRLST
jgi:hypothetical protein